MILVELRIGMWEDYYIYIHMCTYGKNEKVHSRIISRRRHCRHHRFFDDPLKQSTSVFATL